MEHLKNILTGLSSVLVIAPDSDYVRPGRGGFVRDSDRLRGDVRRVGTDMRRVTENYGKQINNRKG